MPETSWVLWMFQDCRNCITQTSLLVHYGGSIGSILAGKNNIVCRKCMNVDKCIVYNGLGKIMY
jgi:hypothetical protein